MPPRIFSFSPASAVKPPMIEPTTPDAELAGLQTVLADQDRPHPHARRHVGQTAGEVAQQQRTQEFAASPEGRQRHLQAEARLLHLVTHGLADQEQRQDGQGCADADDQVHLAPRRHAGEEGGRIGFQIAEKGPADGVGRRRPAPGADGHQEHRPSPPLGHADVGQKRDHDREGGARPDAGHQAGGEQPLEVRHEGHRDGADGPQ
jgi:hypothetical protein